MANDMHCFRDDHDLWREVLRSRAAAHAKHGANSIEVVPADSPRWLPILGEEFGEICRALTYDGKGDLRAELLDVLAVASAWVDAIDRGTVSTVCPGCGHPTLGNCSTHLSDCPNYHAFKAAEAAGSA